MARLASSDRSEAQLREVALNYAVTYAHVNRGHDGDTEPAEIVRAADVYAKYLIDGIVPDAPVL